MLFFRSIQATHAYSAPQTVILLLIDRNMKKLFAFAILLIMILFEVGQQQAHAQRFDLAPNVGYGFDVFNQVGDPGTISIGAQAHFYLREGDKRHEGGRDKRVSLILNPALDYYLFDINGMSGLQLDLNLLAALGRRTSLVTPYAGLGLGLTVVTGEEDPTASELCPGRVGPCLLSEVESGTGVGLNLLAGALWGQRSPRIITQFRYTIGSHDLHRDPDDFTASSGLAFHGGIIFKIRD